MEDRPEYIIYYLMNRLRFLETQRPTIYHVYHSSSSAYFLVSSQKAAIECRQKGYLVEKANLDHEILKIAKQIMKQKLSKFIMDSVN